ncbi:hypothetical protein I6N96_12750 [Enterococcus sp. BWM-S5]|uniref:Uncharacterized protein n=1 Tax=Enterococcus larvae TaxID=2794352 RepID=A0ABS4CKY5_9ENTE|nr:hypothetical protein [Enterococcus larvae]MBP1047143.1 hypothetical protein [Enterococcus larvae]
MKILLVIKEKIINCDMSIFERLLKILVVCVVIGTCGIQILLSAAAIFFLLINDFIFASLYGLLVLTFEWFKYRALHKHKND